MKDYNFTKENIISSLVPKDIFQYPQLTTIIIREDNVKDFTYKCIGCEVSEDTGYNSWWKNENHNKIDLYTLIKFLYKLDIKSIREFERTKKTNDIKIKWNELIITIKEK